MNKITDVLKELGYQDNDSMTRLAEYLFADIFVGRPEIDPAYL